MNADHDHNLGIEEINGDDMTGGPAGPKEGSGEVAAVAEKEEGPKARERLEGTRAAGSLFSFPPSPTPPFL